MTNEIQMLLTSARLREIAKDLRDAARAGVEVDYDVAGTLQEMAGKLASGMSRKYALQHIDGNRYNNEPGNLRLVTVKENRG